jgi:F-type H+-transporting ATPase subunit delta
MRERYVAREYARLLLRYEPDECASIKSFFAEIGRASKAEPRLASFLCHPAIPREEKLRVLASLAKAPPGPLVVRMLGDLVKRRIIGLFGAIAEEMDVLADEARNIAAVSVTSAAALPDALRTALAGKLAAYTGSNVKIDFSVDPALISGLLVRIGDRLIDNTIKTDLEHIRSKLIAVSST